MTAADERAFGCLSEDSELGDEAGRQDCVKCCGEIRALVLGENSLSTVPEEVPTDLSGTWCSWSLTGVKSEIPEPGADERKSPNEEVDLGESFVVDNQEERCARSKNRELTVEEHMPLAE